MTSEEPLMIVFTMMASSRGVYPKRSEIITMIKKWQKLGLRKDPKAPRAGVKEESNKQSSDEAEPTSSVP